MTSFILICFIAGSDRWILKHKNYSVKTLFTIPFVLKKSNVIGWKPSQPFIRSRPYDSGYHRLKNVYVAILRLLYVLIGSLSNDYADGNENGKKSNRFD